MKKTLFLLCLTFLSGCSWMYRLRIYNKTEKELNVRYKFHPLETEKRAYDAAVFSEKMEVVYKKGEKVDSNVQYQYLADSNVVSFVLKKDQIATIGWGRNTTYKWLMERKERNAQALDSLPPWINEFNLEKLWISSPDREIYIREYMIDSLIKGKRKPESRLVIKKEE